MALNDACDVYEFHGNMLYLQKGIIMRYVISLLLACAVSAPSFAATSDSYAKLDQASEAACIKSANLTGAMAGPPIRYSDRVGIDARVVTGSWPQPHMKGAKAKMLCLYNRKNKKVEIQELADQVKAEARVITDIWWRAENVGGKSIVDGGEISLMLGSDGKAGGKSGCNGYSANYQITGNVLKIYPPIISTRMMCAPALMEQERTYQALLESARSIEVTSQGMLLITSTDGLVSRFNHK